MPVPAGPGPESPSTHRTAVRLRDTGSRLRAALAEDPYGGTGTERNWSSVTTTAYSSSTQPRSGTEQTADRALAVGTHRAYLYPDADVTPADRWLYRGRTFQIHSALMWPDLAGRDDHLELDLSILDESA